MRLMDEYGRRVYAICLVRYVGPTDKLGWGWGAAYRPFDQDGYMVAPIPLNLVIACGRWLYMRLSFDWVPGKRDRLAKLLRRARQRRYS